MSRIIYSLALISAVFASCSIQSMADAHPRSDSKYSDQTIIAQTRKHNMKPGSPGQQKASNENEAANGATEAAVDANEEKVLEGVNGPGTVRVNNLANLEALLNILANSSEIVGIQVFGGFFMAGVILNVKGKTKPGSILICVAIFSLVGGLATPGIINWLIASARDANLFS